MQQRRFKYFAFTHDGVKAGVIGELVKESGGVVVRQNRLEGKYFYELAFSKKVQKDAFVAFWRKVNDVDSGVFGVVREI